MARSARLPDFSNSKCYQPRPIERHAVLVEKSATYNLDWGTQHMDGAHMLVDGQYGIDLQVFKETYKAVEGKTDYFVKTEKVQAYRVTEDTEVSTKVRDREEMKSTIVTSGWIIKNPSGEIYTNTDEEFARRYILCEEKE